VVSVLSLVLCTLFFVRWFIVRVGTGAGFLSLRLCAFAGNLSQTESLPSPLLLIFSQQTKYKAQSTKNKSK